MPQFGKQSMAKLITLHRDLQTLCNEIVKHYDISVVYGHRSMSIQNALYLKGRKLIPGKKGDKRGHYIVTNIQKVVTYRGFDKKSNHNHYPSRAVDIVPYPSCWSNANKIYELAGYAKATWRKLKLSEKVTSNIRFGADWKNPADPAHIEIII